MATYDVTCEQVPQEPYYDLVYQSGLQKDRDVARAAVYSLETAGLSSVDADYLQRLIADGKSLSNFEVSNTRTIAILGGSGEGKSSLINSLLHFPDIAASGDIGAACTSVVTEFRLKTASHLAPITMEVEYLSAGEREELLKELLWSFRRMYLPNAEDDDIAESEYAKMERESAEAWSSLDAAFGHHEGFSKRFLMRDMSENGLAVVTSQIIQWAHELVWPASSENGKWTSTAETADECYEKTSVFMEDQFWPFTKIIRIYIEAQILKAGIILADLPGLHDTNLARVKATQDYLLRCDHIFVVARISRAITNQSLKSSLLSILSKHASLEWDESGGGDMKIAVICTNSEDINEKSARREFCGGNNRISFEDMVQLDQRIANENANGNRDVAKKLKMRQRLLLINARNDHVKEGLQKAYSTEIPEGVLEVFCVSNTNYEKYAMKGDIEMVQASGIPDVRRFCYTVTSHAHLLEANHFRNSKMPSFLNSALLFSTKPTYDNIEAKIDRSIYFTLYDVKTEVSGAVSRSEIEFNNLFQRLILAHIDQESGAWEGAAKEEGLSWCHWHWSQYKAWCRNDGDHMTRSRRANWNAELSRKMRTDMGFRWEALKQKLPTLFTDLLKSIKELLLMLQAEMREKDFNAMLVDGIDLKVRDIEYQLSQVVNNFSKSVDIIRTKSSEPNQSSYIVKEMTPAYRSAAQEFGAGMSARQRNIVQGRLDEGTLFSNLSTAISEDMKSEVSNSFSAVQKEVDDIFLLTETNIRMGLAIEEPSEKGDTSLKDREIRKEGLACELQNLKRQHEEVLAGVDSIEEGVPQIKEEEAENFAF